MAIGLYGKLPSHGDFVLRGLRDSFVDRWDAWLQSGLAASQRMLGERWLEVFLTSPVWRFALSSGVIDGAAWAGIFLPSVDRVGRYFPFTIAAELGPAVRPFEFSVAHESWYAWAEALGRRALEQELLDLDRFAAELRGGEALLAADGIGGGGTAARAAALDATLDTADSTTPGAACAAALPERLLRFDLPHEGAMGRFFAQLAERLVGSELAGVECSSAESKALWWSEGSDRVAPTVLIARGLPPASRFGELLHGPAAVETAGTAVGPAVGPVVGTADPLGDTLAQPSKWPAPSPFESAAATDVGRWRNENQDALLERRADGLWLVADGMGGHRHGALASRIIVERMRSARLPAHLSARAAAARAALAEANAELRRRASEEPGFDAGSTVVALCLEGSRGIVLWAGDSRLYRMRGGELALLTRDHSVAEEDGARVDPSDAHVITRAVGGADVLELEELQLEVRAGDRFLLCTDGLYEDLERSEMTRAMALGDLSTAVSELVAHALEHGGRDNVTAVLVAVPARGASG